MIFRWCNQTRLCEAKASYSNLHCPKTLAFTKLPCNHRNVSLLFCRTKGEDQRNGEAFVAVDVDWWGPGEAGVGDTSRRPVLQAGRGAPEPPQPHPRACPAPAGRCPWCWSEAPLLASASPAGRSWSFPWELFASPHQAHDSFNPSWNSPFY